jgi:endonuclease/exonuclease/phosphatase family metal-dependent hydrolase
MRVAFRCTFARRVAGLAWLATLGHGAGSPAWAQAGNVEPLRVLSFNIRYDNPDDAPNDWPARQDRVAGLIRFHGADAAGLQEVLIGQLRDLEDRLPGYAWVGVGRSDGLEAGEFSPIFYRTDRLELVESGTFWLSDTPGVAGSTGWDAALPRIVTWARFRDRVNDRVFVHFNTHFDHRGERARAESARLVRARIDRLDGEAQVIVTGDLNAVPESTPLATLLRCDAPSSCLRDARVTVEDSAYGPSGTHFGFGVGPGAGRRIDYILVSRAIRVLRHGHLAESEEGFYPSDHLPVLAELVLASAGGWGPSPEPDPVGNAPSGRVSNHLEDHRGTHGSLRYAVHHEGGARCIP